jgi:hypothetical protein
LLESVGYDGTCAFAEGGELSQIVVIAGVQSEHGADENGSLLADAKRFAHFVHSLRVPPERPY